MRKTGKMPMERKCEIAGVFVLGLALLLFLALVTDEYSSMHPDDQALEGMAQAPNVLGPPGAVAARGLAYLVGDAAHILYGLFFVWGLMLIGHRPIDRLATRIPGLLVLVFAVAGMLQVNLAAPDGRNTPGGMMGAFLADTLLTPYFGVISANVAMSMMILIGILMATDFLLIHIVVVAEKGLVHILRGNLALADGCLGLFHHFRIRREEWQERSELMRARAEQRRAEAEVLRERREQRELKLLEAEAKVLVAEEKKAARLAEKEEKAAARAATKAEKAAAKAAEKAARKSGKVASRAIMEEPATAPVALPTEEQTLIPEEDLVPLPEEEPYREPNLHIPTYTPPEEAPLSEVGQKPEQEPEPEFEAELPFDAIPEIAEETQTLPAMEEAEPEAVLEWVDEEALEETVVDEAPAPEPKQAPVAPTQPSTKPKRRVRRKADPMEELPADYVYPKRYAKPSLELFDEPEVHEIPNLGYKLRNISMHLEETLKTFSIEARVTDVTRGPTITRFEIEPSPGVKVSRFLALSDDIALALKAHRVRVEAPIPGKGRVGIEVPNEDRDQVLIRELLESGGFQRGKGKLKLALGKDISGDVQIADLATMPHLLVAGATGAGKTVCVKALLASLLCRHTPDELQLMLIDPKMVELSVFNDIPHLITPVVTDPKKASTTLTWLINEMEERYRLFADLRVRNIEVYNKSVDNGEIEVEGAEEDGSSQSLNVVRKLPYIVCVIDELADLMMLARSEVEDSIGRLAQLARAVGIHLIIATQRPSVDVLTGVIKANFPARISFQVSSRVDSRCILDEIGAERLIGMGDLLYLPAGQSKPTRIQGAFVSDEEMNGLIAYLKRQAPPQYRDEIENYGKSKDATSDIMEEDDPLFEDAVQVVMETGQASISMVQRRLRVGYTRAARLIDMMELKGLVGPHTGSKAREILVDVPQKDEVA